MIKLKDNLVSLQNLPVTIKALEELDHLIKFYSANKPGPAYCAFKYVDGSGDITARADIEVQFNRKFIIEALHKQRQVLVDYLYGLGIEA